MAGLLEQAGYEPTDDAATPTSSSSTPAAFASAPRTSSTRGSASSASWRRRRAHDPIVAVAGCVAQQEGDDAAASVAGRHRRHRRHAEPEAAADAGRDAQADATARGVPRRSTSTRTTTCRFRSAWRGAAIRCKAYVTIIEGCNEFCASASCRTRAATSGCGRRPTSSRRSARRPTPGTAKCSCSGRSSITTRRPTTRRATSRSCWRRVHEVAGHRAHPVRQPASAARHAAADRRDARPAEGLPAPAPAGAVGLDARAEAMRRRYTREEYLELVAELRATHAGHRAVDRYDRRLPGRDGRGLRGDAVADGGGRAITACSRSSTRRGRTRWRSSGCRTTCRRTRRRGGSWRCRRSSGRSRGSCTTASSAGVEPVLVDATSRRREWELSGRTSGNTVVNFPATRRGSAGSFRCGSPARIRTACAARRRRADRLGRAQG